MPDRKRTQVSFGQAPYRYGVSHELIEDDARECNGAWASTDLGLDDGSDPRSGTQEHAAACHVEEGLVDAQSLDD